MGALGIPHVSMTSTPNRIATSTSDLPAQIEALRQQHDLPDLSVAVTLRLEIVFEQARA